MKLLSLITLFFLAFSCVSYAQLGFGPNLAEIQSQRVFEEEIKHKNEWSESLLSILNLEYEELEVAFNFIEEKTNDIKIKLFKPPQFS